MSMNKLSNINIDTMDMLVTLAKLKLELPLQGSARDTVAARRQTICRIVDREDLRLLVVAGHIHYMILNLLWDMLRASNNCAMSYRISSLLSPLVVCVR